MHKLLSIFIATIFLLSTTSYAQDGDEWTCDGGEHDVLLAAQEALDSGDSVRAYELASLTLEICEDNVSYKQQALEIISQSQVPESEEPLEPNESTPDAGHFQQGSELFVSGMLAYVDGRYVEALDYYQQALTVSQEFADDAQKGTTFFAIADTYRALGEYDEALGYYQQTLAVSQEIGDRALEGASLYSIGEVYHAQGHHEETLQVYWRALAISREMRELAWEGATFYAIGEAHHALGHYEEAIDSFRQALINFQKTRKRSMKGRSLYAIGGVFQVQGNYERALEYFQRSLVIFREIADRAGESTNLKSIGDVYRARGQFSKALNYYSEAIGIGFLALKDAVVGTVTLTVLNSSEARICTVFISPTSSDVWGEDQLGAYEYIGPDHARRWEIKSDSYDILLNDCDGNRLQERYNVDLTESKILTYSNETMSYTLEGYIAREWWKIQSKT